MELTVISSGSHGNCYYFQSRDGEILVMEAGVPFKKVKPAIDFKISNISGLIVSHSHGDHSGYVKDYLSYSIPVYCSSDTITETGLSHHCLNPIETGSKVTIGGFTVMPFDLKHDVRCYGFLVKHSEMGVLLFATDTYYIPNKINGLNHILIEANYDKDILSENISSGRIHPIVRKRTIQSHMEIGTVEAMLKANDLSKVKNIVLLHLSGGNSDESGFKKRIQELTGVPVYIANSGLKLILNNY